MSDRTQASHPRTRQSHPSCRSRPAHRLILALIGAIVTAAFANGALAVPAFNRQTGQNCVACHAGGQFPELTAYGRLFKLTGYTLGSRDVPLSLMAVAGYTRTEHTAGQDPSNFPKNGAPAFQGGSVFVAGKVTDNLGVFAQITYDNYAQQNASGEFVGHSGSDNMDFRYADRLIDSRRDLIFGATVNNNPTVQDPWNSTPAWAYPYVQSSFQVSPSTNGPLLTGDLAQQAAGAGAYLFWNKTLYAELSLYRTANGFWSFMSQGTQNDDQTKLKGANPYWRFALSHEWGAHSAMVGVFGLEARVYPDNEDPTGDTSRYRDVGVDAQYQYLLDPHAITVTASYIHERTRWAPEIVAEGESSNASDTLYQLKVKGSYVYQARYGASLTYFRIGGSTDAALYGGGVDDSGMPLGSPVSGNLAGSPGTSGVVAEIFWTPVQWVRVGAQYWAYTRFNGASSNYDGFGRNARDNNTLFVYVWGAY
ncbi:MAG TPA: cytochrome C [Casimicrobiaceae bacterium]|nr:cytochrome C [Casimicrobiaceae bacterium]